jgi:hypothetical protein
MYRSYGQINPIDYEEVAPEDMSISSAGLSNTQDNDRIFLQKSFNS